MITPILLGLGVAELDTIRVAALANNARRHALTPEPVRQPEQCEALGPIRSWGGFERSAGSATETHPKRNPPTRSDRLV